jgi:hypothetical protein
MADGETNERLAVLMTEAGWAPRALARALNGAFGEGTVSATAPYFWRDHGAVPHAPLPALVANALSVRLGRRVTAADIWDYRAQDSPQVQLASAGMNLPWSVASTRAVAEDWLIGGLVDRRDFLAVSGSTLASAVSAYLADKPPTVAARPQALRADDLLIERIEASVPELQQLDDAQGGATSLSYVGAQLRAVALAIHERAHSTSGTRRLLMALADLGQLAGWMAFDASQHGLAQRYFFTGLRAAHDAGYSSMAAHILADLSFQAATRGHRTDGVTLGEAASRQATRSSAGVRASVASRLAYAYASAGNIDDFERTYASAVDTLGDRDAAADPSWLYYLTPSHLDCQAGYALVLIGREYLAGGDRVGRAMLRRGGALLRTGAHCLPYDDITSQRRALYEGAWLALAYAGYGDLERACAEARMAIGRLGSVRSPRSNALLRQLSADFRRRTRNPHVGDVLPDLERAIAAQRTGARAR